MKSRKKREDREYNQQLIHLARVTRVMAGGKRMRFRAVVAIGDGRGKVGAGVAKGADVTVAINKAVEQAKKVLIDVPIVNQTIPHEIRVKYKAAKIMLKPAPAGTGIKAGSVIRQVLELAGVPNVVAKILGTRNKLVNVQAVMLALKSFKTTGLSMDKKAEKKTEPGSQREDRRYNSGRPKFQGKDNQPKKEKKDVNKK